ncbi:MAG TPA: molecular chaperone Skp [Firmicutes bacterium]|nr:molecular chaperone Skp [Bacillota bacterium]
MNMKMWRRVAVGISTAVILGMGTLSGAQSVTYAAPAKAAATIGFVDMQQVVSNSPDYKNAQDTWNSEADTLQKEFDSKSGGLSDAEKQQLFAQYQQKLALRRQELMTQVKAKVDEAIKNAANEQGISVVLDKESVLYGGKDLTQDVVNKIK